MATQWEEIKRLAADFQKAQDHSTANKLSERNCIEVISKLLELKLLDVYFTTDGKEYITPDYICKEIRDELFTYGGRVALTQLVDLLNLDYSIIESKATEIVKAEPDIKLLLGFLIDKAYVDGLCEELNEQLQHIGQLNLGEVAKHKDLPLDFIQEEVEGRLGSSIEGQFDPENDLVLYTETYVNKNRARIVGVLSAVTGPVQLSSLVNSYGFNRSIFYAVLDDLISCEQLPGSVSGGKQEQAIYVPYAYTKAQNEWVSSFFRQNGYLEYDSLVRLGLTDPQGHIRRRFKTENIIYLPTVAAGQHIMDMLEGGLEDALSQSTWIDVSPLLPSILQPSDIAQLLRTISENSKTLSSFRIFCETVVMSESCLQDVNNILTSLAEKKAQNDALVKQKEILLFLSGEVSKRESDSVEITNRKDERKKKQTSGVGKSGGGTQGREVKTKAVKNKYKQGKDTVSSKDNSDNNQSKHELIFMEVDDLEDELRRQFENGIFRDCPEEIYGELAEHFHRHLTKYYQTALLTSFQATSSVSHAGRKKQHADLEEKVNTALINIRIFEKAYKLFPDDIRTKLTRYMLQSLCKDVTNSVIGYLAYDEVSSMGIPTKDMSSEIRLKLINNLSSQYKPVLIALNNSINGKSVDEFVAQLELVCEGDICDVLIKKMDRKKERQAMLNHRQSIIEILTSTADPCLALHATLVILFQVYTQQPLHASGKFVPNIMLFLKDHVKPEDFEFLQMCQGLVMKTITDQSKQETVGTVLKELEDLMPRIKEMGLNAKKFSVSIDAD